MAGDGEEGEDGCLTEAGLRMSVPRRLRLETPPGSHNMFHSTPCLTSRHRACADAACRCICHRRADGANRGPSLSQIADGERANKRRPASVWADTPPDADTISPADQARLQDPELHPCAYCGKPSDKRLAICDECFDIYEKGKTAEERAAARAQR